MNSSSALRIAPETPSEDLPEILRQIKAEARNFRAPAPETAPAAEAPPAPRRKFPIRKAILGAVLVAVLSGAAWYGHDWYTVGRFVVSTDDAYVKSDTSALGAKVAGYVATVPVSDNSEVKAGDVLMTLDAGDYKLAAESAKAKIASQLAAIDRISKQVEGQHAQIDAARAQYDMAVAQAENSDLALARQQKLGAQSFASQQAIDDAATKAKWNRGAVEQAKAAVAAATNQLDVLNAQEVEAHTALKELQVAEARAERDYSFTVIRAPFDGIVANRAVEPGQYVDAGQRLMALVPTGGSYIEANFKETQIAALKPGQAAEVSVDAFNGETVKGLVESIAPASGAEFSLLPPENATGNFTKVTQRVPVRVVLPASAAAKLRPGLSVTVSVNTLEDGVQRVSSLN
jgi:membrane fusion protein (multidrug efflux system)